MWILKINRGLNSGGTTLVSSQILGTGQSPSLPKNVCFGLRCLAGLARSVTTSLVMKIRKTITLCVVAATITGGRLDCSAAENNANQALTGSYSKIAAQ